MTNQGISKKLFNLLDRVTDIIPEFGPKIFEKIFLFLPGMAFIYKSQIKNAQKKIRSAGEIKKMLFIADINIGDSILVQGALNVIKSYYPDTRIDFFCNKKGGELFSEDAIGVRIINEFGNSGIPNEKDSSKLSEIIEKENYSIVFNVSPFVEKKYLKKAGILLNLYVPIAYYLMHKWKNNSNDLNISLLTHNFFNELLQPFSPYGILKPERKEYFHLSPVFKGNNIQISKQAQDKAKEILYSNNITDFEGLFMLNPVASSEFTTIPDFMQAGIIEKCVKSDDIKYILICEGKNTPGIEKEITKDLTADELSKIVYIPFKISLSVYAALIDFCDVFISGDTGPVHIAAAKKEPLSEGYYFRNSTSVITVFGGTDSRIYGYDTDRYGHIPANQSAPSKVFVGDAKCRNITCLNKLGKSCRNVRCFDSLNPDVIADYITSYFRHLNNLKKLNQIVKIR